MPLNFARFAEHSRLEVYESDRVAELEVGMAGIEGLGVEAASDDTICSGAQCDQL
jgi:hypothetical protein